MAYISLLIKLIIFFSCLIYIFKDINFCKILSDLIKFSWLKIIMLLIISFLGHILLAERLQFLFNRKISFVESFNASMICLAINNVLPAKIGEVGKVIFICKLKSFKLAYSLSNIFWERFSDLNILLLLSLLIVFFYKIDLLVFPILFFVILIWTLLSILYYWPYVVIKLMQYCPVVSLRVFMVNSNLYIRKKMALRIYTLLGLRTLIIQFVNASYTVLALIWVANLSINVWQALVVFLLSAFAAIIPSLPGGFGVFEAAVVFSLSLFGIEKEQALTIGFILHMIQYIPTTLIGLIVVGYYGFNLGLVKESRQFLNHLSAE